MTKPTTDRLKYTFGIIHCPETEQILLLNREKAPWKGRWNGVGGKLDADETPLECIIRETKEETGLYLPQYQSRGILKWNIDSKEIQGMYLFTAVVTKEVVENYLTPTKFCHEGILDWKLLDWVLDEENTGVVNNVQIMLQNLFRATDKDLFSVRYQDGQMLSFVYYPGRNVEFPVY